MMCVRILICSATMLGLVACGPSARTTGIADTQPVAGNGSVDPEKGGVNSAGMTFAHVPSGQFMMGSPETERGRSADESPRHSVRLNRDFFLGTTEVTQGQWLQVMGTRPWAGQTAVRDDPRCPVVFVSWDDARAFCETLSTREGRTYRLPTEAEWEYACRAGTTSRFACGRDETKLDDFAWHGLAGSGRNGHARTVASRKPNLFGLYDMHGNVSEWCAEFYGPYPSEAVDDPTGPPDGEHRVIRGGSWYFGRDRCRSANRGAGPPHIRDSTCGFRIVLEPDG